ncbi:hypothetical protein HS096_04490 [candidate division WWE3 bacterium]|uniref:Uncharacterized protein n=1 Tax=candidate division WWE3 bacterium TaxID=2053526 RepID=A0A928TXL2_UNCKA|nr:hypothetical protein [candidate division WWE3 bacterium]
MHSSTKIFFAQLHNSITKSENVKDPQEKAVRELETRVNDFLKQQPNATVSWLQNSAAYEWGAFTQLTAIATYSS